ncbi:MAG: hypothetical protein AB1641_30295 [Thermodesulfobacteriota bacterium]
MSSRVITRYGGIFIVSLVSIAYEIYLTRHFAITNWSEYGYWIISIAMVGFSLSGVIICLFKDFFQKYHQTFFFAVPPAMMVFSVGGFALINSIQFNPLELQNAVLWSNQIWNIGKCYLALFPFFFASGLFVGLSFLVYCDHIPKLYTADLVGAGLGALILLAAMSFVHPFYLLAAVLPILWLAVPVNPPGRLAGRRGTVLLAGLVPLLACLAWLWWGNNASFCQYKAISTARNVENNRVVTEYYSPRGYYQLLHNYTERLDVDLSNNYELLGAAGPPDALGLYRDGDRITAFPRRMNYDLSYTRAALNSFPYILRGTGRALLIGSQGGFRIREALELGAAGVEVLETEPVVHRLLQDELKNLLSRPGVDSKKVSVRYASPHAFLADPDRRFEIIDVSSEFLDQGQANKYVFTVEGFQELFSALSDQGVLSVPILISEFTVYAVKTANTIRQALSGLGLPNPENHILVYRSSWNARILVGRSPFREEDINRLKEFCAQRSFDTSYYPGLKPEEATIWNDLPAISFENETMSASTGGPRDALMDDLTALFGRGAAASSNWTFFNLTPSTYDRPFFYAVLKLRNIKEILKRIDLVPRPEMGNLINLAVLTQAVLFALIVLFLPLIRRGRIDLKAREIARGIFYFMCLGLGFLFVEIVLIERFTLFLNDAVSAFGLVLSVMLIFSGLGSGFADRFLTRPNRGASKAVAVVILMLILLAAIFSSLLVRAVQWPWPAKYGLIVAALAPLSFAMGMPFPLGLSTFRGTRTGFLPWAWSINGAFSVIATPLANILAVGYGYSVVLLASAGLYFLAAIFFPKGSDTTVSSR